MKIIYVCSPLSGNPKNIEKAKEYCIPFAPHIYFTQFMDDNNPNERRLALEMNKRFLELCDELWILGIR